MSIPEVVRDLAARGISTPLILRVKNVLDAEIRRLNRSFSEAIDRAGYRAPYRGVFPIKVNHQSQVIQQVVESGREYDYGLEVGSKPELVIALSHRISDNAFIICNGVKDREFIKLAILSRKIGFNTIIVLESLREVALVVEVARDVNVEPLLGVRIKLTNQIGGKWKSSSGDRSAFGMNTDQLVQAVDLLRKEDLLHCLCLQHSHLGSQIPDVNDVRRATIEACRFFSALTSEGAPLRYLDLGGGLGVDYTGEQRTSENSINYTIEEYCTNVVEVVSCEMDGAGLDHPTLITESGRAVSASSSILIFDVLDSTLYDAPDSVEAQEDDHHFISDMRSISEYLSVDRLQECWNDAQFYREELRSLFRRGQIEMRQMARAEKMYMMIMGKIRALLPLSEKNVDLARELSNFADLYHCNFSIFQSLPDSWAIDQIHPIVPLQMLDQDPDRRAILSDITCDSDGKIDRFVLDGDIAPSLPVHTLPQTGQYYIGVFFVGAYQETLGDLHNLFGDTNVATIELREDGRFDLLHEQEGDTVSEVLSYVEYEPTHCLAAFRKSVDDSIRDGSLTTSERRVIISAYRDSMNGYTYFE